MHFSLKGLIENGIAWVILDVLPAGVAMSAKEHWSKETTVQHLTEGTRAVRTTPNDQRKDTLRYQPTASSHGDDAICHSSSQRTVLLAPLFAKECAALMGKKHNQNILQRSVSDSKRFRQR